MNEPTPRLQIRPDGTGLVLTGEIDAHTAPELASHLDPLPDGDGDVVVDLAGIEFVDSSGLRLFVEVHHRAEEASRRLVLRHPSSEVIRLLEISGLTEHLTVESD